MSATAPTEDLRPRPGVNHANAAYWRAAAEHRLELPRCDECGRFQYPPDVACVHCQSTSMTFTPVGGTGTVYSHATVERLFHVGWTDRVPYVVAIVELDDQPGLRMLTNLVDVEPADVHVGMPVQVAFEDRGDVSLPQFRPAGGSA